jgi:hypothetical protein
MASAHVAYSSSLAKWLKRCPSVGPRRAAIIAELLDHAPTNLALLVERAVGPR